MSYLLAQSEGLEMLTGIGSLVFGLCCTFIPVAIMLAGMWKIFEKAGKPGWAALVPIYNIWVFVEISGKETFWFVLFLIPMVNVVAAIMVDIAVAEKFGKDTLYGVGMALLPFIFFPLLGFSDAQYQGTV